MRAIARCTGCKRQVTLDPRSDMACVCGGDFKIVHPNAVEYKPAPKPVEWNEDAIQREVERGMTQIYERLRVERELDRYGEKGDAPN